MNGIDTIGSWDFNPTIPRTPLRTGSGEDPFASFSIAPSPIHTLPHRRSSSTNQPSLPDLRNALRTRESSRTGSHRRQVSFDGGGNTSPPVSPKTANGFSLSGSVHFEEPARVGETAKEGAGENDLSKEAASR